VNGGTRTRRRPCASKVIRSYGFDLHGVRVALTYSVSAARTLAAVTGGSGMVRSDTKQRSKGLPSGVVNRDSSCGRDSWPFVSVIVPFFGSVASLTPTLQALERQTYPADRYEVAVVNNGARIDLEVLGRSFPRVIQVSEEQPGAYAARNRGVRATRGEILAFTDSDCLPAVDWLRRGVGALIDPADVEVVGGNITVFARDSERPNAVELHQLVHSFPQEYFVRALRFAMTANLFTYRRTFEQNGPFEAALLSGGDAEWGQRLCAKGARIRFAPAAEVRHPARRTLRGLIRQRRRTAGGRFERARGVGHPPLPLADVRSTYAKPFGRLAHYRSHPLLRSPGSRLRFLLVELVLFGVTKLETARLRLGGRPLR
jgi:cellulose synthase/poly-beta-1,6-N-acetylglucosamine synthase-like glycosyltransferase